VITKIPITEIAAISGTPKVGFELTAGALTPAAATASYQWTISDTVDGTYADINGATTNKYTPVAGDVTKFIKVAATGTGNYSGTKTSAATTAVAELEIGDEYGGGIVAYIDGSGQHGLIAATADQSTGIQWYNGSYISTGATETALGAGFANTYKIIAKQGTTITDYAAGLARAYNGGGYNDWFLPSKDELEKLYINRVAIGGFADSYYYWSSSENDAGNAWYQGFYYGDQYYGYKYSTLRVRAVRAF